MDELKRAELKRKVQVFYKGLASDPLSAIDPFDPKTKRRNDRPSDQRLSDKIWDFAARRRSKPPSDTISSFGSRDSRKWSSKFFLDHAVKSQTDCCVQKGCSWSGGNKLWSEKWLGITCVALHGLDSLCVVARKKDLLHLEKAQSVKCPTHMFLSSFWNVIVSDVEDIEEHFFGVSCLRPFSVVTVGNHFPQDLQISRAFDTTMFLQGKLKSDPSLTSEKTIQTALLATQYLYGCEFEAGELQVFVWQKDQIFGKELLPFRENPDLEEYLASVNGFDIDDLDCQEYLASLTWSKRHCLSTSPSWSALEHHHHHLDALSPRCKFYKAADTV